MINLALKRTLWVWQRESADSLAVESEAFIPQNYRGWRRQCKSIDRCLTLSLALSHCAAAGSIIAPHKIQKRPLSRNRTESTLARSLSLTLACSQNSEPPESKAAQRSLGSPAPGCRPLKKRGQGTPANHHPPNRCPDTFRRLINRHPLKAVCIFATPLSRLPLVRHTYASNLRRRLVKNGHPVWISGLG